MTSFEQDVDNQWKKAREAAAEDLAKVFDILRGKGHKVVLTKDGDLFESYGGASVSVGGVSVEVKVSFDSSGSFRSRPTGNRRYYVKAGGYRHQFKKIHMTKKATGLDHEAVAATILDAVEFQARYDRGQKAADKARKTGQSLAASLRAEFYLTEYDTHISNSGESLGVQFSHLTAEQARAFLKLAQEQGLLTQVTGE